MHKAIVDVKNEREDMRLIEQHLLVQSGVITSSLEDEDFFLFMEVMAAKERDDRAVDPADAFKAMRGGA
ncbi:hypothetical protein [Furfurilactobacillus siliginis]|uniref:Uncharacterized protein n=1 Tax=Furfurilactobacillus siliginis TaxID=348151 RepID=A0A0R2LB24_9LACO|nr:hypothetical protein [Furfurilactobacillus siliginis]KRN96854.1 hypothetical protein IV55_GL000722 [Furfurilactobacillus siliginis]GEK28522.1 hypothetical protein LSI01_08330 [Furfurilactobacillus siliginis]